MAGSVVHVVWEDNRDGNEEIYYKRSTDGGLSWGEDKRLTVDPANSIFSNIISSGSMVHVVWQDTRNGLWGIYYICSTDGGLNWGSEVQLNEISSESLHPFITVSGPVLHAMWYDFRDLNYEIYYKPNPTGGFPVGLENEKGDYSGQQTRIYPNPASNVIHINPDNYSGGKEVLSIRNILGKELLNKQIQKGESMVDVSSLQNGFYFVSVMTNKDLVNCTRLIIAK
jgi:hypothetical protein